MEDKPCDTCMFFCHQTKTCGAYEIPAEVARLRTADTFCGPDGSDHQLANPPLMQPWQWAIVGAMTILAIACGMLQAFGIPGLWP